MSYPGISWLENIQFVSGYYVFSVVGTLHQNSQAPSFSVLGEDYKLENQVYDAHSHTGTNPNVDFVPSAPDINAARSLIMATPNAKVYIYVYMHLGSLVTNG